MQIKKDDTVVVIAGKDKGKTGTVLRTSTLRQPEHPDPRSSTWKALSMHPTSCSMTRKLRQPQESVTRSRTERK